MYAKVDRKMWPLGLEEIEYLSAQLGRLNWKYEVRYEMLMFAGMKDQPQTKFAIWKWTQTNRDKTGTTHEVIWEGSDKTECTGILRMLIAVAESDAPEEVVYYKATNRYNFP